MQFCSEPVPFPIPSDLRTLLGSYVLEFGTGGGIGEHLPGILVWSIRAEGGSVLGYAWLAEHRDPSVPEGYHVNLAVFPERQHKGAGSFALEQVEQHATAMLLRELLCQVNSNKPETGAWVRQWLLRRGYAVLRNVEADSPLATLPDSEFVLQYWRPLYFRKPLPHATANRIGA